MWSIDLTDAYHHMGLHEDDVHYFTFVVEIHGVVQSGYTSYTSVTPVTPVLGVTLSV